MLIMQGIPSAFIEEILNRGCKYLSLEHASLFGKLNLKNTSQLKVILLKKLLILFTYGGVQKLRRQDEVGRGSVKCLQ